MMAGVFAQRAPVEYVMVALSPLTDEPVAGDGYAVTLRDVEHVALAIASVGQLLGKRDVPPLPAGSVLGFGPPQAVAVELPPTDDGTHPPLPSVFPILGPILPYSSSL